MWQLLSAMLLLCLMGHSVAGQRIAINRVQKDSIIHLLSNADDEDQHYRNQMEDVQKQYGGDSPQMQALLRKMAVADSINLILVSGILERFGWLGKEEIGERGATTLFMVIQHSNLSTQDKYLPLMRTAATNGNASLRNLALLEDRVALYHGRRQLYGSQVIWNMKTDHYQLAPLDDPEHVDARRAAMGLPALQDYLDAFGITWDVVKYKKELPALDSAFFKRSL